jgi:rhamnosyltransferase
MKLAGVVVLYEPDDSLLKNIDSYITYLDKLYVIDNSKESHKELFNNKKIDYTFYNDNKGIAKALNDGCKKAINDSFEWILTMDQDTYVPSEALDEMIKYIKKNDTSKDGIITVWHESNLDTVRPKEKIDYPLDEMTSGEILNLNIFKKIGEFREDFFIDGVDMEYNLRLKKNGYRIVRLNNVSINHNLGNVTYHKLFGKTFLCTNHSAMRNYYMQRNYRYINEAYKDIAPEFCDMLIHIKLRLFKIIMFENNKIAKIKAIFKGIKDYKKGITGKTY